MIDLVEEYFKRDLSAAEEAQLAKLLAASPEAALKTQEDRQAAKKPRTVPHPAHLRTAANRSSVPA